VMSPAAVASKRAHREVTTNASLPNIVGEGMGGSGVRVGPRTCGTRTRPLRDCYGPPASMWVRCAWLPANYLHRAQERVGAVPA
jgi:hypothetical protein